MNPFHVVHANWFEGALHLWAERAPAEGQPPASDLHPGAAPVEELEAFLSPVLSPAPSSATAPAAHTGVLAAATADGAGDDAVIDSALQPLQLTRGEIKLRLPSRGGVPLPSPRLSHARGEDEHEPGTSAARVEPFRCPTLRVAPADVGAALERLEEAASAEPGTGQATLALGPATEFFAAASRFVRWLMVQQRLVPTLVQDFEGSLHGLWQPWLADDVVATRLGKLLAAMPPVARAQEDNFNHQAWPLLEDFLVRVTDAQCRAVMLIENMAETIEGRRNTPGPAGAGDPHVQWLAGLLDGGAGVPAVGVQRPELLKRVRTWIGVLDQRAFDSAWRLCIKLSEPTDAAELPEFSAPGADVRWPLSLHLQSVENPSLILDARDIWILPTDGATVGGAGGRHIDKPQEILLAELGRAARLYKPLEDALKESEPAEIPLTTARAYEFLREIKPVLMEQGFGVIAPEWWDSPGTRLGVRLRIDSPDDPAATAPGSSGGPARIGLSTLVNYTWQVSIGQTNLSLQEFERLASLRSPLVLVGGRWVEVRPEDIKAAIQFMRENPGGEMELGRALRMAYDADLRATGVPVLGMEATGWIGNLLSDPSASQSLPMLTPPDGFVGSLRPYQLKGLSWLAFLDRFGLGPCLADDMGLGKTIQFLALLLHERAGVAPANDPVRPTLLIVPMSVVGNWLREAKRFAPSLRVHVHHGPQRKQGESLFAAACESDLVITTYALAHRDRESLEPIPWGRVALDEAQNIKNAGTKQAQAIRSMQSPRRVALTGTPIENRLTELWSIADFLNPGLLGSVHDFRKRFAVPIERYHDPHRSRQLRGMVQPFILRRLKTDPNVITDLPEKVETKEYCYLTSEQAALYERVVKDMLSTAEAAEGIQRRGVILAGLVKLKQICNHPRQYLKDADTNRSAVVDPNQPEGDADDTAPLPPDLIQPQRSGKCARIIEMLDEVIAAGGQALVFTQFRQMGAMLATLLRHELDREVLFLHGGTPAKARDAMVQAFNKGDGSSPVFVLSLKAGGVGLNLTGANHVFHFDRWWNPAVESQATDRAYRIGQTRTVQVHKFVVAGTLEERIDQMIEQKTALLENVIGSGEAWLTELSLTQLRDVLTLRPDAVAEDTE